jgi:hypothetical protein
MLGKLLSLVGGKWGVIAILVGALTIAGLIGFIKLQRAEHASEEIALRSRIKDLREDVQERDTVIRIQEGERVQFEGRVDAITGLLVDMQGQIARNSQQRQTDYTRMARPRPAPGTPANTADMEKAANEGMNGLFNEMEAESQPKPKPEGKTNEAR